MNHTPRTSNRPLVIAAVMASMAMVAIEATIVSTVMPQIAAQLGGLGLYSWVFASYLLTQTAATVVFGKLADLYGRKPVMLAGIAIFLIASVLAGFAWSMPALIAFRLLQGIGAGAVQPVAVTIVADLYAPRERGTVQSYLASVWAVAAVLGPIAGALIVARLSWAWVFWINVPIGIAAAFGFWAYLHEAPTAAKASIDWLGAALFTFGVTALMVALTLYGMGETGDASAWLLAFAVALVVFVWQERRATDPMVSFSLWGARLIATLNGATLLSGMALICATTFLPMYVQVVLGRSSVVAGLALTMAMLGWPTGATLATRFFPRYGLHRMVLIGAALIPCGAAAFVLMGATGSAIVAGAGSFVLGAGMGVLSLSSLILVQESVQVSQRASATASNLFSRNLGSALGATLFGAIFNLGLARGGQGATFSDEQLRALLQGTHGTPAAEAGLRMALGGALHLTFVSMLMFSLVIIVLALCMPRHVASERLAGLP